MLLKDILENRKSSISIAVEYGGRYISYNELYCKVVHRSNYIRSAVLRSNKIGIFLNNSIDYIVAYFSIAFTDNIIVPISVSSRDSEIRSIVEYCEITMIITNQQYRDPLMKILQNSNYGMKLFFIDECSLIKIDGKFAAETTCSGTYKPNEESVAIMLHTSGTTSNPKRVMLTHKNLISNIKSVSGVLNLNEKHITLLSLPLYLASGNSQMLTHLYLGATIIIMNDCFLPNSLLEMIGKYKITNFFGVPFMLESLVKFRNLEKYDVSSVEFMCFGGGPVIEHNISAFFNKFPQIGFGEMYGQTEASPRISHLLPEYSKCKLGSAGKPLPGLKVQIVDDAGMKVESGAIGELIIQGDNVMKGYYKNARETEKAIRNGWLHTGDLARVDRDGFIHIVGRAKNIIIYCGCNIYPEEVEEVLLSHPAVKEAYVYGVEDEFSGQVPIADVVLRNEGEFSSDQLVNYCFMKMESFKVPNKIIVVNQIKKTATGKTKRGSITS